MAIEPFQQLQIIYKGYIFSLEFTRVDFRKSDESFASNERFGLRHVYQVYFENLPTRSRRFNRTFLSPVVKCPFRSRWPLFNTYNMIERLSNKSFINGTSKFVYFSRFVRTTLKLLPWADRTYNILFHGNRRRAPCRKKKNLPLPYNDVTLFLRHISTCAFICSCVVAVTGSLQTGQVHVVGVNSISSGFRFRFLIRSRLYRLALTFWYVCKRKRDGIRQ